MELNVKQSGIERRAFNTLYQKNKSGKVLKRLHEVYLRNDIACGHPNCIRCADYFKKERSLADLDNSGLSKAVSGKHCILVDVNCLMRYHDLFIHEQFSNVIIIQSVWEELKRANQAAYRTIHKLVFDEPEKPVFVFMNEFHCETAVSASSLDSKSQILDQSLIKSANFLFKHWQDLEVEPIVVTATDSPSVTDGIEGQYLTIKEYVQGMEDNADLLDKLSAYDQSFERNAKMIYPEHLTQEEITAGLLNGRFCKGTFNVSRENYLEANVHVAGGDEGKTWFIQGRLHANRAINGDIVAVELLPESEWTAPEKWIRMREIEEMAGTEKKGDDDKDAVDVEKVVETADDEVELPPEKRRKTEVLPTARVVGIIKRGWRQYCGMLLKSSVKGRKSHLFSPHERLIPRIRIETSQYEKLQGMRIIVAIDRWPRDSRYPLGHYVRTLGNAGDVATETELLLLEHDVPHEPFTDAVLACLPEMPWVPNLDNGRVDLRDVVICSVDPEGCTDIDDALHCRPGPDDTYEVGVHIADVTHFLRPNTAMNKEAEKRGTTVYLCDRRIDMLPELLSGNLCSLREHVERYAFSVIWKLSSTGDILSTKFHKSLIKSSGALTYQRAQDLIDDKTKNDSVTESLRNLMKLSIFLKKKRMADGALTLASSEIRYTVDPATKEPLQVVCKKPLPTMSMVEEFMLLANCSVAEKISELYPDCALLRRHPIPSEESYAPLIEVAKARGFAVNTESGKAIAESLNKAVDPKNPMVNTLMRMLAVRCMTQAVYFAAGTVNKSQYLHFGLAAPLYTHFTSPIRRFADVMVHRLLACAIGADQPHASMLSKMSVQNIANNLNYRRNTPAEPRCF
uniref:Protein DIS3 homolog n=1 Tax=Steinernema glaseri TaxID=37863 RepID=A0A1I8ATB4_9BILA